MRDLNEYRKQLEPLRGGSVPVDFVLDEVLAAAEEELQLAHGEFTLSQAMAMSGRSRSWFERRLEGWEAEGTARKVAGVWLLKRAAVPKRDAIVGAEGFDPETPNEEILRQLRDDDRATAA